MVPHGSESSYMISIYLFHHHLHLSFIHLYMIIITFSIILVSLKASQPSIAVAFQLLLSSLNSHLSRFTQASLRLPVIIKDSNQAKNGYIPYLYLITITFQINAPSFCQTSTYKLIISKTSKLTSHTSTSTLIFRFILNILQWPAEKENLLVESHLLEARLAQMETRSNKVIQAKPVFSFLAVVSSVS
ncbi:uncharacterized protein EAF02_003598 [Botrytis sinoallii]|uniref:uncharacterized protein n=1 Tax=Botrytis sinoallii TaxID=1463999 RepID=UPI0019023279|nr:uncharacterized protein EAF02_003598 [Botrytis sinoallii]KAF7886951.1 hypothetical protein EAF02_003598 [Botrytis sinoallii]